MCFGMIGSVIWSGQPLITLMAEDSIFFCILGLGLQHFHRNKWLNPRGEQWFFLNDKEFMTPDMSLEIGTVAMDKISTNDSRIKREVIVVNGNTYGVQL